MGVSPAPYLILLSEETLLRKHDLREVYNVLRWLVYTGAQWRKAYRMPAYARDESLRTRENRSRVCVRRFSMFHGDLARYNRLIFRGYVR